MGSRWVDGVVVSVWERAHRVFFVLTRDGTAAAFPRVHSRVPDLGLGAYVRVRMSRPANPKLNMEVEELDVIDRPIDHEVNVNDQELEITCNASFLGQVDRWFLFDNEYLGLLAMRIDRGNGMENMMSGRVYRVVCRRTQGNDGIPPDLGKVIGTIVNLLEEIAPPRSSISASTTLSSAHPSTSELQYSQEKEWTTVMITGSHYDSWYGACTGADPIRIPYYLNKHAGPMVRGSLYRMTYAKKEDGHYYALEMDPTPIPRDDFQFNTKNMNVEVWCTSRVIECYPTFISMFNEVIGDAILPFHAIEKSNRQLRVGDWMETLYYRVKNNDGFTHWRVKKARWTSAPIERVEKKREEETKENHVIKFVSTWNSKEVLPLKKSVEKEETREVKKTVSNRSVLDIMHHFMSLPPLNENSPPIRDRFLFANSENTMKALQILDKDRRLSNNLS